MKILFVSDVSIQEVIGGAERVLYEQTTRLAAGGHDVYILTRRLPTHEGGGHAVIEGVKEWRYDVKLENNFTFVQSTMKNARRLFEYLHEANDFNCINFHQPFSAYAVLKSSASRFVRKVYTCHSLAFEEFVSRNRKPDGSIIQKAIYQLQVAARKHIERRALTLSDTIVVLSDYTQNKLKDVHRISDEKITIVPGGVDLQRFHPANDKASVRFRLQLPADKKILFTVRNLVPRMGLENLLQAMAAIVQRIPDILLVVGGAGPLKEDLIKRKHELGIDKAVDFRGFIPEEMLPAYYQAADIFVLPTVDLEGFGMVTLEALASGVPVLGTPIGGTREILSRFDTGFMFADASPEAMSSLIIDTCNIYNGYPDRWRADSLRCRQFVEKNYAWDVNIGKMLEIFSGSPTGS